MPDANISDNEIRQTLAGHPKVLRLLDAAQMHFGSRLTFERQPAHETRSLFCPMLESYPWNPVPKSFTVKIQMQSPRAAAHFAHELLHVKFYMDGFPWSKSEWTIEPAESGWLWDSLHGLLNEVQHLIFYKDFIDFGFSSEDFLEAPAYLLDASEACSSANEWFASNDKWKNRRARALFLQQYFSEFAAGQLQQSNHSEALQNQGKQLAFPIDAEIASIKKWIHDGDYRYPNKYADAVNELLAAIGFPKAKFMKLNFP